MTLAPGTRQPCLIEIALEPKDPRDRLALCAALAFLAADEDYACDYACDAGSGQIVLKGQNELHLDILVTCLQKREKLDLNVGAPQVVYRETLTRRVEKTYTYKSQADGIGAFARVKLVVEPTDDAGFESRIVRGAVPDAFVPGVARGIADVMRAGILAGFPVVGVRAILIDGAYHDTDSSTATFEIAARAAFREALREGGAVLLEPIMDVEVTTPEDYIGAIEGDMRARRGEVHAREAHGTTLVTHARASLANLFGYPVQLRSLSQGRASQTTSFSHFAPVDLPMPPDPRVPPVAAALRVA